MGNNSCNCESRNQHHNLINNFWSGLRLRSKTAFFYNEQVIESLAKGNLKNKEIFENKIINEFLINDLQFQQSKNLFKAAFEKYKESLDDLLICLIFLTVRDKSSLKISFKKMLKYYKSEALVYNNISFVKDITSSETASINTCLTSNNNNMHIKSYILYSILKILLELVSEFSVIHLSDLSIEKEDFVTSLTDEFKEEYQKGFLRKTLDKYGKELINIDEFIENEYKTFSDDELLRVEISFMHHNEISNNFKEIQNNL